MMDGYTKIINGLLAESKARSEIAAEDRMRESGSSAATGLIDLGMGPWRPMTSQEMAHEVALDLAEEARLRESDGSGPLIELDGPKPSAKLASYGGGNRPEVAYEDRSTYPLACDLFTVLPQLDSTGSPNAENSQAEQIIQTLTGGRPLSDFQIGLLKELVDRHKNEIDALRASPDYEAKSLTTLPDPATARLVESARGEQVGLQPQQSDASPGTHPCVDCSKGLLPSGASCPTCKGSGIAPGKAQPLAESGPLRGLLAPPAPPDEEVLGADGLFDLGPDIPRPVPRFMQVGAAAEQTPVVSRMRSSAPPLSAMRESSLAEVRLVHAYNRAVTKGMPRRLREARGSWTPNDPENLSTGEIRVLMQAWESGVAA
ncbi:MAG: hypothetical protein WA484_16015 [Solirubrobacteraceae bacterium]